MWQQCIYRNCRRWVLGNRLLLDQANAIDDDIRANLTKYFDQVVLIFDIDPRLERLGDLWRKKPFHGTGTNRSENLPVLFTTERADHHVSDHTARAQDKDPHHWFLAD